MRFESISSTVSLSDRLAIIAAEKID